MEDPSFPLFVAVIEARSEYYLITDRTNEKSILVFKTEKEGLDYYESAYNSAHERSYESSMSACINNIFMHPSIIKVESIADIDKRLLGGKPYSPIVARHVSGGFAGIRCKAETASEVWKSGAKPRLISDPRENV
jgi:hypothetical protein